MHVSRRTIIRWEAGECFPITDGRQVNRKRLYALMKKFREYDTEGKHHERG